MAKITARISDKTEEWLKGHFENKTTGGEYLLDSFPQLYKRAFHELCGTFSQSELHLMLDVMNGTWLTPGVSGQHIAANVSDGITLDRLDEKWEIDGPALNGKIQALEWFQRFCLEIWAVGFWVSGAYQADDGMEEWIGTLTDRP